MLVSISRWIVSVTLSESSFGARYINRGIVNVLHFSLFGLTRYWYLWNKFSDYVSELFERFANATHFFGHHCLKREGLFVLPNLVLRVDIAIVGDQDSFRNTA